MVEEGVLDDPRVDAVVGLPVSSEPTGTVRVRRGPVNGTWKGFAVTITGKGAHGSTPQNSVDPIVIASHVVIGLQTIVSREVAPDGPTVVTVGAIHAGTVGNVIPERATIRGTIRAETVENRDRVVGRVAEVLEGIVASFRGTWSIEWSVGYPPLSNDDRLAAIVPNAAHQIVGQEKTSLVETPHPGLGVESFAFFAAERPAVMYTVGAKNEDEGLVPHAHTPLFDIDEACLPIGVAMHCRVAWDLLSPECGDDAGQGHQPSP